MTADNFDLIQSRRKFFRSCGGGLGTIALAQLLARDGYAKEADDPLSPRPPHFPPKAKNVIFLFQEGAPSQMDLFDPKPELRKWNGQPLPPSMTKDLKAGVYKTERDHSGEPARVQAIRPVRDGAI